MIPTEDYAKRLAATPLVSLEDAHWIVAQLGALYDREEGSSKQGGGGKPQNHRWPNGRHIDLRELTDVEGCFRLFKEWKIRAAICQDPNTGMFTATLIVKERSYTWASRTIQAALWLAMISSKAYPHSDAPV